MGDSVLVACVIPDAADTAFQIHCLERSAYAAVLRAFRAQSDLLSPAKQRCLVELRNELKILESEHRECLGKARSNKQINSLSAGLHSKGNTCNTEVMKDTPDLACVLPDAGDTVFRIHCLERSAYASVLRAFCAVANHLSWLQVKLLTILKNELRISHVEHKEVLVNFSSNENIKSLRKFNLANLSVLTKTDPSFDAHAVVRDKIGSTGQVTTSSTSCLSLSQQSPPSDHSMSTTRNTDIGISDSSNGAKEGTYFEPQAVALAKRLKSVNGHAVTYLKCAPSDRLPVAVSTKSPTDDTLDSETVSCEVKSGCTSSSPIFQEKHSESNAGQVPSCVDHARQESGKRKAEVPGMRVSTSQRRRKDSDLEHGSEIINLCLTANLLHEVERLLRENPDPANLEEAKSMLKVQEKDLLDALVKVSEVSYDVAYFSANGQPANITTHDDGKGDEVLPKPANSSDETPTRLVGGGAGNHVKTQGVAAPPAPMQPRRHVPASPSSAPAALGESSRGLSTAHPPHEQQVPVGSAASAPPAPSKKRSITTAEQRWRMWGFAHRAGWGIHNAGADAVDAFCAQVGVPRRALRNWMSNNRHLAEIPPPSSPPSKRKRSITVTTEEQRWRMWGFAHRAGWSIDKAGADVDAFCAQVGVPRRALRNWMSNNRHLAEIPPPSSPPSKRKRSIAVTTEEQRKRMREFAHRAGWSIDKAGADVDAFCAQVGVPRRALRNWMSNNRHLAEIPPPSSPSPPLPSHHQDHPPAATPPQGSMTEQGKSPEPEPAAAADDDDDGGEEDENEEASEVAMGRRARKPNKRYGGPEWFIM